MFPFSCQINISDNVSGSSSIVLVAESGVCIIHMGADVPKDNFHQLPSFDTYITPINGVYLLLVSALIIGGTLTCFTLSKRRRHLDGVPYQELEMGQSELVSSVNVEAAEGWDQDWDDDWDEEKAVKSPAGNHVTSRTTNGHTSRSKSDGWGNDWDD